MKTDLKYLLKVSLILGLIIFIIERLLSSQGFNLPINELLKVLSIHCMYAFVLSFANGYFYNYIGTKFTWKENSKSRLIYGALGSIAVTMLGLVVLRFVTIVLILSGHKKTGI